MVSIQITQVTDFQALGERWRDLEQRSSGSFFQCWTWIGCLCTERFPDPILVEATEAGRTIALGLFNRVRRRLLPSRLYLHASGTIERDSPYIEQNGLLTETGREAELTALCLRPLAASHDLILQGVDPLMPEAARHAAGLVMTERSQASPFVDLEAVRRAGGNYLAGRSANTRQQIRRSDRFYQRTSPIRLQPANAVAQAHTMLDRLAALHQATWQARGQAGSFANPFFRRFHQALIQSGLPRGEVTVLEISHAETIIGLLYNFVWKNRMSAYQSGFAYPDHTSPAKPGLTCHHQAIQYALQNGFKIYDFLAGEDRYKRSLAADSHQQFWLTAGPLWSPALLLRKAAHALKPIQKQTCHDARPAPADAAPTPPSRQNAKV